MGPTSSSWWSLRRAGERLPGRHGGHRQRPRLLVRQGARGTCIALGAGAGDLAAVAEDAGVTLATTHVHTHREWLEAVVDLAAQGQLVPTVSAVFDLAEAAEAHRSLESGHTTGKTVLRTGSVGG